MTVTLGKLPARFIAHCLAISFAATAAFAEERRDYVSVSQAAFATLECSVLAAHARYNSAISMLKCNTLRGSIGL